jgi:hypothetical protein
MIQLIFMVVGVVYLFKLIGMNRNTGSELGLDEETLAKWQGLRRKQFIWMIAAGWGSFGVTLATGALIGAAIELSRDNAMVAQIAVLAIGLITMFSCYSFSSRAGKKAKEIEARKARPEGGSSQLENTRRDHSVR